MDAVETDLHIAATPQDVWDFSMDPWRSPEWVTIVRAVECADDGPLEAGYRMEQRLSLRGVPFVVRWELVEADAPRYARWEGRGPARSQATIEDVLEPEAGGTRFRYRNAFRTPLGALGAVASRALVGGVPRHEACASLERLKAALEGRRAPRPLAVAA